MEAVGGHVIFAHTLPNLITRTRQKNLILQDLMLSSYVDKNCSTIEDFDDLKAERKSDVDASR